MSLQTGQYIGPYKIIGKLGSGGMAHVYRGRQESIERDVAIKIVQTERGDATELTARFKREAQMLASLSHPHIIKVFDYGRDGETFYLVMELFEGGTLSDRLQHGPLTADMAQAILHQMADALDYIHKYGIIHRDLKPSNILFDRNGYAILTDFGISKRTDTLAALTMAGTAVGTLAYMAPEQLHSPNVDKRVDVYALGVVLYEMLTTELPFVGQNPDELVQSKLHGQIPSILTRRPELPAPVSQVLDAALAISPDHRYPSAGSLSRDFDHALNGQPLDLVPENNAPAYAVTQIETPKPAGTGAVIRAPVGSAQQTILEPPLPSARAARSTIPILIIALLVGLVVLGTGALLLLRPLLAVPPTSLAVLSTTQPTTSPTANPSPTQPILSPTAAPTLVVHQAATVSATETVIPTASRTPTATPTTPSTATAEPLSSKTPTAYGLLTLPAVETLFAPRPTDTGQAGLSLPSELIPLLHFALIDSESLKRTRFSCGVFQQVMRNLQAIADGNEDPAHTADARSLLQNPAKPPMMDYCADPSTPQDDQALSGDIDIAWGNFRLAMISVYTKYVS